MTQTSDRTASALRNGWSRVRKLRESQRHHLNSKLVQANGLLKLLMKRRNGERWSAEERAELRRGLSKLSPYLLPLLMPGGFLLLPLMAWWFDRRHRERNTGLKK